MVTLIERMSLKDVKDLARHEQLRIYDERTVVGCLLLNELNDGHAGLATEVEDEHTYYKSSDGK